MPATVCRRAQAATVTPFPGQGARMFLLDAATAVADGATRWLFVTNSAMFDAACTADHVRLGMIDTTEEPGVPVEQVRVARTGPGQFVWHATLGLPVDPDQTVMPSGMRHVLCASGTAPARWVAHQQAGKALGFLMSPFLTLEQ